MQSDFLLPAVAPLPYLTGASALPTVPWLLPTLSGSLQFPASGHLIVLFVPLALPVEPLPEVSAVLKIAFPVPLKLLLPEQVPAPAGKSAF